MVDVIVIGAGPVGLKTAIELKLRSPHLSIVILEKYEEYQRKNVVSVESSSMTGSHPNPEYQAILNSLIGNTPTSTIESKLKAFALKIGITIKNEKVEDTQLLQKQYPEAKVIIGADGSHSIIRKQIFEGKKSKQNLQYAAEIKFEVSGKTRPFSLWSEVHQPLLKANHLVVEQVGKQKENGNTPVTLRIFIDKSTFDGMRNATFKNPYQWTMEDKKKMSPKLVETIESWLAERTSKLGDKVNNDTIKISTVKMNVYNSKQVVLNKDNKTWVLVGDAAFGVPYFRSLNNGFLCSSECALRISEAFKKKCYSLPSNIFGSYFVKKMYPLQAYCSFVYQLSTYEYLIAHLKALALKIIEMQLKMARAMFGTQPTSADAGYSKSKILLFGMGAIVAGVYMSSKLTAKRAPKETTPALLEGCRSRKPLLVQ